MTGTAATSARAMEAARSPTLDLPGRGRHPAPASLNHSEVRRNNRSEQSIKSINQFKQSIKRIDQSEQSIKRIDQSEKSIKSIKQSE